MTPLLIFTDLDGTLLDHDSYDWRPARRALEMLHSLAVPVIPVSSKTAAEIQSLMGEIGLDGPWISENGSALGLPSTMAAKDIVDADADWIVIPQGAPYAEIRATLRAARDAGFRFRGFADFRDRELADLTGLTESAAAMARQRHCSEPLIWLDDQAIWPHFVLFLAERGLRVHQGGRFPCVCGSVDKGGAVRMLMTYYRERDPGCELVTIGLGDSPNDLPLLAAVDYPVLIAPGHTHQFQLPDNRHLLITQAAGPSGWQWAIEHLLEKLGWL